MENEKIVKPLTIRKEEFTGSLVELCNGSGLPFFIIESTLKDLLQDIHAASARQLEIDRQAYKNAVLAAQKNEKKPEVSDNG